MKTGKYFLGGAVKGLGGNAVKFFMKQPFVKKQIADKITEINNVYAKASKPKNIPVSKSFKNALKKLDKQEAKALIVSKEMNKKVQEGYDVLKKAKRTKFGPKVTPSDRKLIQGISQVRTIQSRMIRGMRQLSRYRKRLGRKASAMMQKEISGKKPN